MRKRTIALLIAAMLLVVVLGGCGKAAFNADGTIKAKSESGELRSFRLVEIMNENGQISLFIQGSEDDSVCLYAFSSGGFDWQVYIDAAIVCDGQEYDPVETIPYFSSRDGNVVQFVFDTDVEPERIRVFVKDNPTGAVEIATADLSLDPELYISDTIATLE